MGIFTGRDKYPDQQILKEKLSITYPFWESIIKYIYQNYSNVSEEWHFRHINFEWGLWIKLKKRNLIYLIPNQGFFICAFVFGKKGVEAVMNSEISDQIKVELSKTRKYLEGTGFRIDVKDDVIVKDIYELIQIKIDNML